VKKTKNYESGLINRFQRDALIRAIESGSRDPSFLSSILGSGPVEEFEEKFARASGGEYAVALSSCTAAIHTALMPLEIAPGDEVVTTPYTWGQSVAPVLFTGATIVFADIDPKTMNIDPNSVADRVSPKTAAILPVHLFGNPADMDALHAIAERHNLAIISDAAQAFGALSKGRKIGSLGDVTCFSLGRGKAVCGGEGGVLVTNNRFIYEQAVAVSQHPLRAYRDIINDSIEVPFWDELGWNYRIHPLAAVLALADLEVAHKRISHRRSILKSIHREFESIPDLDSVNGYPGDRSASYGVPMTYSSSNVGVI